VSEQAPDYLGRVAGARNWRVATTLWARMGGLLWAHAILEPWPTGKEYEATCVATPDEEDHVPPAAGCSCGVWAFFHPSLLAASSYGLEDPRHVSGVVGAAGEVELGEIGWRAQRATVQAIFADGVPDEMLPVSRQEIAQAYDIPIIGRDEYEAFCESRGLIVFAPEDV
jgi:hypothetical protein